MVLSLDLTDDMRQFTDEPPDGEQTCTASKPRKMEMTPVLLPRGPYQATCKICKLWAAILTLSSAILVFFFYNSKSYRCSGSAYWAPCELEQ